MATHPVKLDPTDFYLTISGDTFTHILATTVGHFGTREDGFFLFMEEAMDGFAKMQVQIDGGDHDLDAATKVTPVFNEPFIDDAQKAVLLAFVQGQVDLSIFDGTFVQAPQPPDAPGQGGSAAACATPMPTIAPEDGKKWCCINGTWWEVPVGTDCTGDGGAGEPVEFGGGGGGSGGGGPCNGGPLVELPTPSGRVWVCID